MTPLRPPLRPVSLANRYFGYIVTVILTGYAKADLGKQITRRSKGSTTLWLVGALKTWQGLMHRYYPDKNKKSTVATKNNDSIINVCIR